MLFDAIDTQQLSQDSLILLFDITDYTKYIKKEKFIYFFLILGIWENTPQNYCICEPSL